MTTVTQLKERDRLRAALLSSVSHDLRTPLTTILGVLAEIQPANDEQGRQIKEARGEAERLSRFVANLLDMVRIETGALHQSIEPVDLAEAVAAAVHDLRRVILNQSVRLDVSPDLPLVLVDPQLFHHCLINLIENAAKYGSADTPITIAARRNRQGLTLAILDEGPGFPRPARSSASSRRSRASKARDRKGGTGLGLAIVKGFAEAMGITVIASNRPRPAGRELRAHLPRFQAGERHGRRMTTSPKVLVVDDEAAIRRLLGVGLTRAGYRVVEAGSAREALAALQIDKPDAVLLDLGLPDRDGLELVPLIRAAGAAVLVVSARDATDQKVAALDLGADDYVTKPFDTEEVLARIRTALRHRLSAETETPVVLVGDIEIDLAARLVRRAGEEVHLTPKEFGFLAELAKHPGRVVTHAQAAAHGLGAGP